MKPISMNIVDCRNRIDLALNNPGPIAQAYTDHISRDISSYELHDTACVLYQNDRDFVDLYERVIRVENLLEKLLNPSE